MTTEPTTQSDEDEKPLDPAEVVLDTRRQRALALRKCTPKERAWIRQLPKSSFRKWAASRAIGLADEALRKMLLRPRVIRAYDLTMKLAETEHDITEYRILQEYARLAFSDLREFYNDAGELLPPKQWSEDAAAAVCERSFTETGLPKIKLHDKKGALDALAKFRRMMPDRLELTGANGEALNSAPPVIHIVRYEDSKAGADAKADPARAD